MRKSLITLVTILALVAPAFAQQAAPPVPAGPSQTVVPDDAKAVASAQPKPLTQDQKQQLQIAALSVENWQLKAQQAAAEWQKAQTVLNQLITQLTPPGYQINEKLELVKVPEKK